MHSLCSFRNSHVDIFSCWVASLAPIVPGLGIYNTVLGTSDLTGLPRSGRQAEADLPLGEMGESLAA